MTVMKKFKYRLEALLKAKEHIEKEKQKQHATALQQVHNQQQSLKRIDRYRKSTLYQQRRGMTGSMSVAEMLVYCRYILKLKRDTLAGGELLKALKETEQKKRQSLVEASKERKVYEKLKERRREQFNNDVSLQTTKENDEIALNSFRLKGG
jgi:flagellar FliJ protein